MVAKHRFYIAALLFFATFVVAGAQDDLYYNKKQQQREREVEEQRRQERIAAWEEAQKVVAPRESWGNPDSVAQGDAKIYEISDAPASERSQNYAEDENSYERRFRFDDPTYVVAYRDPWSWGYPYSYPYSYSSWGYPNYSNYSGWLGYNTGSWGWGIGWNYPYYQWYSPYYYYPPVYYHPGGHKTPVTHYHRDAAMSGSTRESDYVNSRASSNAKLRLPNTNESRSTTFPNTHPAVGTGSNAPAATSRRPTYSESRSSALDVAPAATPANNSSGYSRSTTSTGSSSVASPPPSSRGDGGSSRSSGSGSGSGSGGSGRRPSAGR